MATPTDTQVLQAASGGRGVQGQVEGGGRASNDGDTIIAGKRRGCGGPKNGVGREVEGIRGLPKPQLKITL